MELVQQRLSTAERAEAQRREAVTTSEGFRAFVIERGPAFLDGVYETLDVGVVEVNRALTHPVLQGTRHETGGCIVKVIHGNEWLAIRPDFSAPDDQRPGIRVLTRDSFGRDAIVPYPFARERDTLVVLIHGLAFDAERAAREVFTPWFTALRIPVLQETAI